MDLILFFEFGTCPVLLISFRYVESILSYFFYEICKASLASMREKIEINTFSVSEEKRDRCTTCKKVCLGKIFEQRSEFLLRETEDFFRSLIEKYWSHSLYLMCTLGIKKGGEISAPSTFQGYMISFDAHISSLELAHIELSKYGTHFICSSF